MIATKTIVRERTLRLTFQGKHTLHMPGNLVGKTCGILPLGVESAYVTTTGLEWDLRESSLYTGF